MQHGMKAPGAQIIVWRLCKRLHFAPTIWKTIYLAGKPASNTVTFVEQLISLPAVAGCGSRRFYTLGVTCAAVALAVLVLFKSWFVFFFYEFLHTRDAVENVHFSTSCIGEKFADAACQVLLLKKSQDRELLDIVKRSHHFKGHS